MCVYVYLCVKTPLHIGVGHLLGRELTGPLRVCFRFTTVLGFQTMIKELYDMAGQHETIAENLNTSVVKDLQSFMAELKQERKKVSWTHITVRWTSIMVNSTQITISWIL